VTKWNFSRLRTDQRGAVSFEMPFVFMFMIFSLLLPLTDLAIAGFRYISAYEAMRGLGQYLQYHAPTDVTNWSNWASSLPATATTIRGYTMSNVQVMCTNVSTIAPCSSTNPNSPMFYTYTTTVTLSPMVLNSVLCSNSTCTSTLQYSERFQ
jgi:hypothetical protein